MNIIRAYPSETQTSAPARLVSALRRFLLGRPPVRQPQPLLLPPPGVPDLHATPLPGEARLVVAGWPPGAWRKAVLEARQVTGTLSEAVNQAVVTLYQRAPTQLVPAVTPPKPLPRGARPGGPRLSPRTVRLVPDGPPAQRTDGIQVATYGPRPEEWIETPAGMWAPQSGVYRPKHATKALYSLDDEMGDVPTQKFTSIPMKDYAAILSRLNRRPLDRSYQYS